MVSPTFAIAKVRSCDIFHSILEDSFVVAKPDLSEREEE